MTEVVTAQDKKPVNVVLSVQIPSTLREELKLMSHQKFMGFPEMLRELLREAVRLHKIEIDQKKEV
jgi:hypothetical protein